MNGQLVVVTEEESMMIEGGGIPEAVGYGSAAYTVGNLSAAVLGTVTGTASLVTTGALVASGVGLGLVAAGLAGYAVYSALN